MRRLARTLIALAVSASAFAPETARAEEPKTGGSATKGADRAVEVDGTDVAEMSNIEDATLEGLLDLDLEDQLGRTEAVSRTSESILRAPATMTTVDATQIRLSGATTVPDVLRSVPGVAVFRNAPGNYVVSLRGTGGLASNNIVLLVDGVPLNNPLDGTVSWDLVPLDVEDIERIEVVRGPVSPSYGANAYTGVINVVTRTTVGLTPSYGARVRGGGNARGGGVASASGRFLQIGKTLELKWFLNAERDTMAREPASTAVSVHDAAPAANRIAMLTALSARASAKSRFSLELGQVWSERSSMEHLSLDSDPQARRLLFGRALYELTDPRALVANVRLWAQGISLGIDSRQRDFAGFSYDGANGIRGTAGTDLVLRLSPALSTQIGGQAGVERIDAPFVHPKVNGAVRPAHGFYAGLKATPLASLDLLLTGRGDLSPIAAKLHYSYRASAVYHTDTWGLRLTGASAFRTPTYVEAAGRFVDPATGLILLEGTDSIGTPRNTSLELGATFSPHSTLIVASTLYVSRLSNLMVEDFESVVRRTFHNDPGSHTYLGAELEATWRLSDTLSILPSFSVIEWLEASERIDTNVGVPSQNSRFLGALRLQGLFGNETWGYGLGASVASARRYNVRTGIPPLVLSKDLPTTARFTATLEHQLSASPSLWASLRLGASLPGDAPESPLPLAAAPGQSAILGVEMRRQ